MKESTYQYPHGLKVSVASFLLSALMPMAGLVAAPCNTAPIVTNQSIELQLTTPAIVDVLADVTDPDGQMLAVSILSTTTCPAQITRAVDPTQAISIFATKVAPPCQIKYRVDDGAGGTADASINVSIDPKAIFADGFELGNTSAWDETFP